jgi:hypothetical protein
MKEDVLAQCFSKHFAMEKAYLVNEEVKESGLILEFCQICRKIVVSSDASLVTHWCGSSLLDLTEASTLPDHTNIDNETVPSRRRKCDGC